MDKFELVIVGGGLASARAIRSYRESGGEGSIALISRDSILPYHRPPLSKRFLRGETDDEPLVEDEQFYADHGVEVMLETTVERVDTTGRFVEAGSDRLGYEKLLLATGSWPRRLEVPGSDLDGVFTLRTFDDSKTIREAAKGVERAVVVGAGFIGMEVTASLTVLGVPVTQIHLGGWLFDQLGVEELGARLSALYREKGVDLVLGHKVGEFAGNGRLERVKTINGREIDAQIAVVGVGVTPAIEFLEGSGIAIEDGIVVDEAFRTNIPDVYAVGDAARFFDPLFGKHRRIEHWSNANYQGTEVGKVLAGAEGGYDQVSSFFSEVFGITIKVFGDGRRDARVVTHGGSLDEGMYALYGDEKGETIGALSVGQSEEVEELLKQRIREHAPIGALD
jgi:NADPH-dependent 2,4-dienoyl-CoA reductase/sulfur reductase-like enzyme